MPAVKQDRRPEIQMAVEVQQMQVAELGQRRSPAYGQEERQPGGRGARSRRDTAGQGRQHPERGHRQAGGGEEPRGERW
jgi:hypothetical protein